MSGTRVPAGIADAGGEANDSPGSGPRSDGDLDAWMSMRLPVSTELWREEELADEQATINDPTTTTATTCKGWYEPDTSEGQRISRSSSLDDVEIERLDHQEVKPDPPQTGRGDILGSYRATARTVALPRGGLR